MKPVIPLFCLLLAGCGVEEVVRPARTPITVDSLGLAVSEIPRQAMLSDRRGGFLVGTLATGGSSSDLRWTVSGQEVFSGLEVSVNGTRSVLRSALIAPHRLTMTCNDGSVRTITPLEGLAPGLHGFAVDVLASSEQSIRLVPLMRRPGKGFVSVDAGPGQLQSAGGASVSGSRARFLVLYGNRPVDAAAARDVYGRIDTLEARRRDRLNDLLSRTHFSCSDARLTLAMNWLKLSLDALILAGPDTVAVAGLPWDGSVDLRDISRSLGGVNFALGEYATAGAILRALARWQDTVSSRQTFGRLPAAVGAGTTPVMAPEVAPWFVREMYDHVTRSQDTSLVRHFYPVVKRSIEGTSRYHVDRRNLMTHGSGETWMGRSSFRGNRAAEMQLLWYFQQLVGSYMATFVGDWKAGERWTAGADTTGAGFNELFIDTTRHLVYDYLTADGKGSLELRPNAMICLEIIGTEIDQQTTLKRILSGIVYPHGVGTLGADDKGYSPYAEGGVITNGPVATWLTGQLTYALTRYDRQDVSYIVTSSLFDRVLDRGMAGTLPEGLEVTPHPGETAVRDAGRSCSLAGMAEVVRAFYQDYLGTRGDATSGVLSIQPKLPEHLSEVDFTFRLGAYPVQLLYRSTGSRGEIFVDAGSVARTITLNILWPIEGGSAWRGSVRVPGGARMRVVMDADDMEAYRGAEAVDVTGKWKVTNFSRRKEFSGFELARPRGKR